MQNLNQFGLNTEIGQLDLQANGSPAVFTCKLSPSYAGGGVVPGEGVDLVDLAASDIKGINPIVGVRALTTTAIFGVKISNTKSNTSAKGDIVQIAGPGSVIWLNSNAAIVRGASVELVLATPGNVVTRSTGTTLGRALDKASAADELIRVLIA